MRIIRTLALGVAAAVLLWTAARALAGPPAGYGPGGRSVGVSDGVKGYTDKGHTDRVDGRADRKKGNRDAANKKQAKKPTGEKDKAADDNEHSNKGGSLRGLDRADQVAGEHGKLGRENARGRQAR